MGPRPEKQSRVCIRRLGLGPTEESASALLVEATQALPNQEVTPRLQYFVPAKESTSAEIILIFELTPILTLTSEPIVFVSMSPYSKLVSNITGAVKLLYVESCSITLDMLSRGGRARYGRRARYGCRVRYGRRARYGYRARDGRRASYGRRARGRSPSPLLSPSP